MSIHIYIYIHGGALSDMKLTLHKLSVIRQEFLVFKSFYEALIWRIKEDELS